ncbi:MAG: helicase C-terminal domain-containing protein [Coraliomargaritaceae bacterium]|jgi:DNA excision repair protein ERCC-2
MQIDAQNRIVQISVGELARFQNSGEEQRRSGLEWRAELGRNWHTTLQEKTAKEYPLSKFEIPVKKQIQVEQWTFEIQGRIDQLITDGSEMTLVREVKTIRYPLPEDASVLRNKYPQHFAQLAIYRYLIERLPDYANKTIHYELSCIDIHTGFIQSIELNEDDESYVHSQLQALLPFLKDRLSARVRLNDIALVSPFPELRDGQADLLLTLSQATLKSPHILLQAPTGFGKTGIVLHHAFSHMKQGHFERLIYLTAKSTGQLQTLKQLNRTGVLRYVQMRNRSELSIESTSHTCTEDTRCDAQFNLKLRGLGLSPDELFHGTSFTTDQVKQLGSEFGLCPYALTKWALQFAEIWIGDTNYIFSPNSRNVFLDTYGFNPKTTLLIIDEAHNLPERTAEALSIELNAKQWQRILDTVLSTQATRCIQAIAKELLELLYTLKGRAVLSETDTYTVLDLLEDFSRELNETPIHSEDIPSSDLNLIYQIPRAFSALTDNRENYLLWSPKEHSLKMSCLDAASWIAQCLKPFASSIHMSATIEPLNHFQRAIGLTNSETTRALGEAPWRMSAYDIAFDVRIDTRYKSRERYYGVTAETIQTLYAHANGLPIAIFFPSYQYAQNVEQYLKAIDPSAPITIQPKNLNLKEQKTFIEATVAKSTILFLVLGSAFTEGIDTLGGKIELAMVVSPSLPEINPLSNVKLEQAVNLDRASAFQKTYIIPAFQKIHQALGRLARAPGQKAKILLHCRRFIQPEYKTLLAKEYQSDTVIQNSDHLVRWLEGYL